MDTTQSVLLYGSEIWADTLKVEHRRKVLAKVQRTAALRVASAYRTVSEPAVLVISGVIPIDLLAKERRQLWLWKKDGIEIHMATRQQARKQTFELWQDRWTRESKGRWTAKLIKEIETWHSRNHGEVNFYITQMLSGHGYFRKYLYNMGKTESPACIYGDEPLDDANHTFFKCHRWKEARRTVENKLGELSTENISGKMIAIKKTGK